MQTEELFFITISNVVQTMGRHSTKSLRKIATSYMDSQHSIPKKGNLMDYLGSKWASSRNMDIQTNLEKMNLQLAIL